MTLASKISFPLPGPSKGVVGAVPSFSLLCALKLASLGLKSPAPERPDICTVESTSLTKFSIKSLRMRLSSNAEVVEIFSANAVKQRNVGKSRYLCIVGVLMNSFEKFRKELHIWTATAPSCLLIYASRNSKRNISWLEKEDPSLIKVSLCGACRRHAYCVGTAGVILPLSLTYWPCMMSESMDTTLCALEDRYCRISNSLSCLSRHS
jgi:hypothetical protein